MAKLKLLRKKKSIKKPSFDHSQNNAKKNIPREITQMVFLLLVFLLPTQLGKHFFFDFSYINGVRVDYLAPTLFFTDILVCFLIILNLKSLFYFFRNKKWLIVLGIALIDISISLSPFIAVYRWIKVFEVICLFIAVKKLLESSPPALARSNRKMVMVRTQRELSFIPVFLITLTASTLLQLTLSTLQLINKHTIQGAFYFLGERAMTLSSPDIAKISLQGVEFLRPYGTFSHPNSLAGFYLLLYFFVLIQKRFDRFFLLKNIFLLLSSLLIFISFSKIAIMTFVLLNIFYLLFYKKMDCKKCLIGRIITLGVLAFIFSSGHGDPLSLSKRWYLIQQSFDIFMKHPLFGVGLGNFVIAASKFPSPYPYPFFQPVHNIIFLFLTEMGILGSMLLFQLINQLKYRWKKEYLFLILPVLLTGMFDHYWITLQQNLLLIPIVLAMGTAFYSEENNV